MPVTIFDDIARDPMLVYRKALACVGEHDFLVLGLQSKTATETLLSAATC